jgi:beta-galactosidase
MNSIQKNKNMRMKFRRLGVILSLCLLAGTSVQASWFKEKDLIQTGVYYYPEHWDESQWERDFKRMHELGFEFTHFAEFAWAQLEPEEGRFDFAWLDKAIGLAAKYDLKVVLCTSTATPPVWLSRKYPEILLRQENGIVLDHGARQHASFASPVYRKLAFRMIEQLARRYGHDARVVGWQLDNEPAVQFDYNPAAEEGFRTYLRNKYQTITQLNQAWGTAFWSQVYASFDEITLPKTAQVFMNHHQILDYRRFAASQTNDFLNEQCLLIKKYAKDQWVTTNYIPNYEEGHIGGSPDLDFVSYTRYMVYGDNEGIGRRGYRVGNPLRIAWANDFFRPVKGVYGVMELQPGQVNWGGINPQPLPGAVRLWLWSVFAGGSDFVCTYRYRQPLYGTEQYHYGIVGTDGVTVTPGGREYEQFIQEIKMLRQSVQPRDKQPKEYVARKTAILFNHENSWSIDRQKQTYLWNTLGHIDKYYRTLKSFGAPVDFITEKADLSDYPVVIVPAYQMADNMLVNKWKSYVENGGNLVVTCRTAQKDRCGRLPEAPFGSVLTPLTGNEIEFYDLLLPSDPGILQMDGKEYTWNSWGEIIKPAADAQVWCTYSREFYEGKAAVTFKKLGKGTMTYIGVDSKDGQLEKEVLKKLYAQLGIPCMDLPYGVTLEYRNGMGIVLNYSDRPYTFDVPEGSRILVGNAEIPTAGVLVFSIGNK